MAKQDLVFEALTPAKLAPAVCSLCPLCLADTLSHGVENDRRGQRRPIVTKRPRAAMHCMEMHSKKPNMHTKVPFSDARIGHVLSSQPRRMCRRAESAPCRRIPGPSVGIAEPLRLLVILHILYSQAGILVVAASQPYRGVGYVLEHRVTSFV